MIIETLDEVKNAPDPQEQKLFRIDLPLARIYQR